MACRKMNEDFTYAPVTLKAGVSGAKVLYNLPNDKDRSDKKQCP